MTIAFEAPCANKFALGKQWAIYGGILAGAGYAFSPLYRSFTPQFKVYFVPVSFPLSSPIYSFFPPLSFPDSYQLPLPTRIKPPTKKTES